MIKTNWIKVYVKKYIKLNIISISQFLIDDVSMSKSNIILKAEEKLVNKKKCC